MYLLVDLAPQYLRCTGHSKLGDMVTQRFLGALRGGTGFLFGCFASLRDDPRSFDPRLVDDCRALLLG